MGAAYTLIVNKVWRQNSWLLLLLLTAVFWRLPNISFALNQCSFGARQMAENVVLCAPESSHWTEKTCKRKTRKEVSNAGPFRRTASPLASLMCREEVSCRDTGVTLLFFESLDGEIFSNFIWKKKRSPLLKSLILIGWTQSKGPHPLDWWEYCKCLLFWNIKIMHVASQIQRGGLTTSPAWLLDEPPWLHTYVSDH